MSKALVTRVYRIRQAAKERKFRRNPELLEEKGVSCSQYSVLQSQESDHLDSMNDDPDYDVEESDQEEDKEEEKESQKGQYRKKYLKDILSPRSRRLCVAEKGDIFCHLADQEGVTVTELIGYLLYLENWNS